MTSRRRAAAILAALVALTAGCSLLRSGGGEVVSAENLQKDIASRLTAAGHPPKSVTCQSGLADEAGASTRCDVVLTDTNGIEPVVTLTTADPLNYVVTPAVSADQLAKAVAALLGTAQVTCAAGLDGKAGAQTQCDVTRDGTTLSRTIEVTNVEGLLMSYSVLPVKALDKVQVQGLLADRLAAEGGSRPERTDCDGDLQAAVGASVECTVVNDGQARQLTLTVTKVDGDVVDFGYAPKA